MVEKIWKKFEVINPLAPADKLQEDAVRQLANHIINGKASINDVVNTAAGLRGGQYDMIPIVPTSILKYISEWRYSEIPLESYSRYDDLYEHDSDDDDDLERV